MMYARRMPLCPPLRQELLDILAQVVLGEWRAPSMGALGLGPGRSDGRVTAALSGLGVGPSLRCAEPGHDRGREREESIGEVHVVCCELREREG
jgi:hypothetical protein